VASVTAGAVSHLHCYALVEEGHVVGAGVGDTVGDEFARLIDDETWLANDDMRISAKDVAMHDVAALSDEGNGILQQQNSRNPWMISILDWDFLSETNRSSWIECVEAPRTGQSK
jgi:hypothetical protein